MNDFCIKSILDEAVVQFNTPDFIPHDPVQFPRRFSDPRDIEIAALLVSTISWGKRSMILRDADKLLSLLGNEPYRFVMSGNVDFPTRENIHRTFFTDNLAHYLRGLRVIYRKYGSLEAFAAHLKADNAWDLAVGINAALYEANQGIGDSRCLPTNINSSALKRLNMALRWLVRKDGIVDIGIWDVVKPSQLSIPLDVHVGNISRTLGLLTRKGNDRTSVQELTGKLRILDAEDPVKYDFALFGLGESKSLPQIETIAD